MAGSGKARATGLAALVAAVAAAACLAPAAQAQKKAKGPKRAVVTKGNIPIPDSMAAGLANRVDIPMNIGKRFKGRSAGVVTLTHQTTGSAAEAANHLSVRLTSPSGRSVFVPSPEAPGLVSVGPLTLSPDSARGTCSTLPASACADSNNNLAPPYAGTIGDPTLALYYGTRMRGRWFVTMYDDTVGGTSVLTRVRLSVTPARPIE